MAQVTETYAFGDVNQVITDGDNAGIANSHSINSSSISIITDVNVTLTVQGTFNGDLVVRLNHGDTDFAMLLNRVGLRNGSSLGYGDDGFSNVKFDDDAEADVHAYRLSLTGNHSIGLGNGVPLTGTWQPDARNLNPNLETGIRDAFLSNLNGSSGNGQWSLFSADVEFGQQHTLVGWELEISGISAVPEPEKTSLVIGLGCVVAAVAIRRKRKRQDAISI
ncbi:MAG: hypothetical protein MN733_14395 [Nitrososphaera sp.]|nr:hypothetical protein [Nitrososphaera sp.]